MPLIGGMELLDQLVKDIDRMRVSPHVYDRAKVRMGNLQCVSSVLVDPYNKTLTVVDVPIKRVVAEDRWVLDPEAVKRLLDLTDSMTYKSTQILAVDDVTRVAAVCQEFDTLERPGFGAFCIDYDNSGACYGKPVVKPGPFFGKALLSATVTMYRGTADDTFSMPFHFRGDDHPSLVRFLPGKASVIRDAIASTQAQPLPDNMCLISSPLVVVTKCAQCGATRDKMKRCGQCKRVYYCDAECQRAHWRACHKAECNSSSA